MIKLSRIMLLSSAALALCLTAQTAGAANEKVGINAAVKGNVTIQSGEQAALQAIVKDPVLLGDAINSTQDSSLQVLLEDQTVFTVGPNCELVIDKFVYDPDKQDNTMSASVAKGMFRFMSGNISKSGPDSVSIDTPVASMGVRGTMVEGLVGTEAIELARRAGVFAPGAKADLQGASLFVLRGPGRNSKSKNRRGEITVTSAGVTKTLRQSGMAIFVANKDSPPSEIFMISDSLFAAFNNRIRTLPTGGASYKPFTLDPFMEWEPPRTGKRKPDDPRYVDPLTDFDWPGDHTTQDPLVPAPIIPPNCTPADPNYPACL